MKEGARSWTHFLICFCALGFCAPAISAQKSAAPLKQQGQLGTYVNMDAKDIGTRLEVLKHALYEQQQQITTLLFLKEYGSKIHMEQVLYASSNRQLIPAYVFTPVNLVKSKPNPAIVIVHGGFHATLRWQYFPLIADATSNGYVVIFPEYRSSRGYGERIYQNNYGIADVEDVLAAADYISQRPWVDPHRLGIVGYSRGGMTTLLAIEKAPKRFKTAVDIAGMADFLAYMAYKPDYRRNEVAQEEHFKGKLPAGNLPAYLDVSPVNNVSAIQTPLLLLGTTGDDEVPWSLHSGRMIEALKADGKMFSYHLYENAPGSHLFIFGDTRDAHDCYRRTFDWLNKYLK